MLNIALSKGRIFNDTLPLFAAAGIEPIEDPEASRKLIIPSNRPDVQFLIVRASDVPTYVQLGGAHVGVVGKDVLMEHGGEGLVEPLDLKIAQCRLMVAGYPDTKLDGSQRLRVATKFTNCARTHFAKHARQVEIVKLYGSMELAPIVGLCDLIVDVVESGATLAANGLVPLELIAEISSRVVVNRAALKINNQQISALLANLEAAAIRT